MQIISLYEKVYLCLHRKQTYGEFLILIEREEWQLSASKITRINFLMDYWSSQRILDALQGTSITNILIKMFGKALLKFFWEDNHIAVFLMLKINYESFEMKIKLLKLNTHPNLRENQLRIFHASCDQKRFVSCLTVGANEFRRLIF